MSLCKYKKRKARIHFFVYICRENSSTNSCLSKHLYAEPLSSTTMDNLSQHTDQTLVQMYMSGICEAFDTLLARYQDRLYTYIFYAVRNEDLAEDIFQETFVKAITTLQQGRYTESGRFYPWLVRIAHNLIIDFYRNERNELALLDDDAEETLHTAASHDATEDSPAETEEKLQAVCRLMEFLPENQREIVRMRFYQNLTFKEIAQIKGMSINTALGRMRYAILNMRRMASKHHLRPYAD